MLEAGGVIYVCGERQPMEPGVRTVLGGIHRLRPRRRHNRQRWIDALAASKRYNLDVWGST